MKICFIMGQTIVMVTHEPEDEKHVDRVSRLKDGLVEKESTLFAASESEI